MSTRSSLSGLSVQPATCRELWIPDRILTVDVVDIEVVVGVEVEAGVQVSAGGEPVAPIGSVDEPVRPSSELLRVDLVESFGRSLVPPLLERRAPARPGGRMPPLVSSPAPRAYRKVCADPVIVA